MNVCRTDEAAELRQHLAEIVAELTRPIRHAEPYTVWVNRNRKRRVHVTWHPSLLDQLRACVDPAASPGGSDLGERRSIATDTTIRIAAIDLLDEITEEVRCWSGPCPRHQLDDAVRRLVGFANHLDTQALAQLLRDARRWRARARIATGWSAHPWRPRASCPVCGMRDSLRVLLDRAVADCTAEACRAWWDEHSIGVLAECIRSTA